MPNKGNPQNLLRGPRPGDHAKRLSAAGNKARAAQLQEIEEAGELVALNPDEELLDFSRGLARALRPQLRELEKHPKDMPRNLIDGIKELRQCLRECNEVLAARGNVAGPERVFAQMEDRLGAANLGSGPSPFVEHPSRPG